MVKRIIWSPQAIADRISVLDYWYRRIGNKKYSIKLDKSLRELVKKLAQYSPMGRQLKNREERYFVKDDYMIFYEILKTQLKYFIYGINAEIPKI